MLVSMVVVPLANSAQPPVATDTPEVATIAWGPRRADPVRAYDTASGELLFNFYDALIIMGTEVTNTMGTWLENELYWEFSPSLSTKSISMSALKADSKLTISYMVKECETKCEGCWVL